MSARSGSLPSTSREGVRRSRSATTGPSSLIPHLGIRSWDVPTQAAETSSLPGSAYSFGLQDSRGVELAEVNGWSTRSRLRSEPWRGTSASSISSEGSCTAQVTRWRSGGRARSGWWPSAVAYWTGWMTISPAVRRRWCIRRTDPCGIPAAVPEAADSRTSSERRTVWTAWVYVQAKYHVEAYQVDTFPGRGSGPGAACRLAGRGRDAVRGGLADDVRRSRV